jgi:hypothetical protein
MLASLRGKIGTSPITDHRAPKNDMPIRAAFFVAWDESSFSSRREHQSRRFPASHPPAAMGV